MWGNVAKRVLDILQVKIKLKLKFFILGWFSFSFVS